MYHMHPTLWITSRPQAHKVEVKYGVSLRSKEVLEGTQQASSQLALAVRRTIETDESKES
jgi:hypothetical protein